MKEGVGKQPLVPDGLIRAGKQASKVTLRNAKGPYHERGHMMNWSGGGAENEGRKEARKEGRKGKSTEGWVAVGLSKGSGFTLAPPAPFRSPPRERR
mmetsp:Transcript_13603/g.25168  ORF Transcript_13603/g.25168 Transcript_13603/m.25168 type:complete len:97 (+) Transcript_13603:108-398(+)